MYAIQKMKKKWAGMGATRAEGIQPRGRGWRSRGDLRGQLQNNIGYAILKNCSGRSGYASK